MQTYTFRSSSSPTTYTTKIADDGKLLCDCKGWTMRRGTQPRHCKHTKQVVAELGLQIQTRGEFVYLGTDTGDISQCGRCGGLGHITSLCRAANMPTTPDESEQDGCRSCGRPLGSNPTCDECRHEGRYAPAAPPVAHDIAPMLASAMTTPIIGSDFDRLFSASEWCIEEKLDGHRCVVDIFDGTVQAWSRPRAGSDGAKARELPPHIIRELLTLPKGRYDGELVSPGGNAWNVTEKGNTLVLVLFDVLAIDGTDITRWRYEDRRGALLDILSRLRDGQQAITTVESLPPSWALIETIWKRGGEGVIVKRLGSTYQPGHRSADWLKVKEKRAATLTVIGFEAGKSGPCSAFKLRDAAGIETTCKVLGNAMLRDVTAHPDRFIGRRVVISYQQKTPSGTYRHGIFDHFAGQGE